MADRRDDATSGPRIYTRTGDAGTTSLADGTRIAKNSPRVTAFGAVDEAQSAVGLALAALPDDPLLVEPLRFLQNRLGNCAGRLATLPHHVTVRTPHVAEEDVAALERAIDALAARVPALRDFVLPGGSDGAARLHLARTVVRRAERAVLDLAEADDADRDVWAFLNRASDLLFTAARYANLLANAPEPSWDPEAQPGF